MQRIYIICFFVLMSGMLQAQKKYTITGSFPQQKNAKLELITFETLKDTVSVKTQSDAAGSFRMAYPADYVGAAILRIADKTSLIVLLNKENFSINWSNLEDFSTIKFEGSAENDAFAKGMTVNQDAEAVLSGLKYLKPLYAKSPTKQLWIEKEISSKEKAFDAFSQTLPASNYAGYYLTIRKLIQDMPTTANRYIERLGEHEKQFKAIDFSDPRLLHSGLLKELINGYYQLMESCGDMDKVTDHANEATAALLKSLNGKNALKKEMAEYLFKQLEKRSLFKPASFVALTMLNDNSCTLDDKSTALYEQYRKMNVGKKAPALDLTVNNKGIATLSEIKAKYKLVVFGSSWCPKCQQEIPQLKNSYQDWKDKYNLEIVFVSLDTDKGQYDSFVKDFPWISSCDFKGWKSKSAVDYCVFATPTMYLLDSKDTIVLKPFSAAQIASWLMSNAVTE